MDALEQYTIPIKGLGLGIHQFDFEIKRAFFQRFEHSPIQDGAIQLNLTFDKRLDMYVLQFDFEGFVQTNCDRCLDALDLQLSDSQQLLVKLSAEERIEEAEVIYISPEASMFNVAKYAYEFICLSMPLIKVHSESNACNPEMLAYLDGNEELEENEETSNPIWEELKKFKKDT